MSVFASSRRKLEWGRLHLEKLKPLLATAFDPDKHPVRVSRHVERTGPVAVTVFMLQDLPMPPDETALMVGDIIGNFRAALDHMCWELVVRRGKLPAGRRDRQIIQFPFATSATSFYKQLRLRLPGIPPEAHSVVIIKRYQPYRRGYEPQALRLLQRLSNIDKHRVLVPTVTGHAESNLTFTAVRCDIVDDDVGIGTTNRTLKPDTVLATFTTLDEAEAVGQGEVHLNGAIVPHPSFGRGFAINESLSFMGTTIERLLEEVEHAEMHGS
jgi:hypothetical protein